MVIAMDGMYAGFDYYNRGLHDARTVVEIKLKNFDDALYEIEKPAEINRWRS